MVFRDPQNYDKISEQLLDTIYEIETPENAAINIINSLMEEQE